LKESAIPIPVQLQFFWRLRLFTARRIAPSLPISEDVPFPVKVFRAGYFPVSWRKLQPEHFCRILQKCFAWPSSWSNRQPVHLEPFVFAEYNGDTQYSYK
jgi:hypothetical protein